MNWISRMLSDNGEPSSKRVAALLVVLILIVILVRIFWRSIDPTENMVRLFEAMLMFAGLCLGLNVVKDVFAKKPTPDEPPEGEKT